LIAYNTNISIRIGLAICDCLTGQLSVRNSLNHNLVSPEVKMLHLMSSASFGGLERDRRMRFTVEQEYGQADTNRPLEAPDNADADALHGIETTTDEDDGLWESGMMSSW